MCDDFETAEEMPLETEVRHILEERRASRAQEWAEESARINAQVEEAEKHANTFIADEQGQIHIAPHQDEEELLFT